MLPKLHVVPFYASNPLVPPTGKRVFADRRCHFMPTQNAKLWVKAQKPKTELAKKRACTKPVPSPGPIKWSG